MLFNNNRQLLDSLLLRGSTVGYPSDSLASFPTSFQLTVSARVGIGVQPPVHVCTWAKFQTFRQLTPPLPPFF